MSDYSDAVDKQTTDAKDPVVRSVIEQLERDVVSQGDRARLRGATDAADKRAEKSDAARGVFERIKGNTQGF